MFVHGNNHKFHASMQYMYGLGGGVPYLYLQGRSGKVERETVPAIFLYQDLGSVLSVLHLG